MLIAAFAEDLLAERRSQLSEATRRCLEWGLWHLRPFFGDWLLRDIDAEAAPVKPGLAQWTGRFSSTRFAVPLRSDRY